MSSSNPTLFSLFIFFSLSSLILSSSDPNNTISFCPEIEKHSLLNLKHSLEDPNNVLSSWDDGVNCCKWKGVSCNNSTGHVHRLRVSGLKGKINPSLLNLHHLKYLDLSKNNFSGETIPCFIGSLAKLEYLNLSGSRFHGKVPHSIGNLSKLHTLDLEYGSYLHVDSLEWVSRLSQLEYLNMNGVNLRKATNWAEVINSLPRLFELHFDHCSLAFLAPPNDVNTTSSLEHLYLNNNSPYLSLNALSRWIFRLKNLVSLDLSYNRFDGIIPSSSNATKLQYLDLSNSRFNSHIPEWLYLCNDLEYIDLSWNRLSGAISNSVGNLTSLNTLRASFNQLSGKIPNEIAKLCKMQMLDLSANNFQGEISESFGDMSDCFLRELQYLSLYRNLLSGNLSNQFGEFKSLEFLHLEENSLSGAIPRSLGKLRSLEQLFLRNNKLVGSVPDSLGQLFSLELLYIDDNMLEGVMSEKHFANLTKLVDLWLSYNHLITLNVSPNWNPPFQLSTLSLASCKFGEGSTIPPWIETQKNLLALDLSNSALSGDIPTWVWNIQMLDLSHNKFSGSLPRIGNTQALVDLSNNSFSGDMSHVFCDTTHETYQLEVLHLGWNRLSGELPDCWMKWPLLTYLNIGYNNISGSIPNSIGYLARLAYLNLPGNRLSGEIPLSMQNSTKLVKLDLANNVIGGGIPTWLGGGLPQLAFLILRSNNLSGSISSELCRLNFLQILDLSNNMFSGRIPSCFYNLTAMATERTLHRLMFSSVYWSTFRESASVAVKGRELEYGTTLSLVTNMDLSRNNLSGDIPEELTSLVELRSLNLSKNRFTGSIPENIGDMKQLEYLDLSKNSLSGHIPTRLTGLSFLKDVNLSYNNLTGEIPKSTQLGSMDASSFIGNNLCGPPLTGDCSHDGDQDDGRKEEGEEEEEGELKIEWIYVVTSVGYAVGLSVVCSALVLKRSWREAYFGLLEWIWNEMYVYVCIKWNKISG